MEFISLSLIITALGLGVLLVAGQYWLRSKVATSDISDQKIFILWTALSIGSLSVAIATGMAPILFRQYQQGMPISQVALILLLTLGVTAITTLLPHVALNYFYPTHYVSMFKKAPATRAYGLAEVFLFLLVFLIILKYFKVFERWGISSAYVEALRFTFLFMWVGLLIWRAVKTRKSP